MEFLKYLYRAYRYKYRLDPQEIGYIINNLNEGEIAVDVGSHKGGYLYWLQKCVGKNGKAYAFEPQLLLYNYLQDMAQNFGNQNVIIENKGISSKHGTLDLFIPITKSGSSPGARVNLTEKHDEHTKVQIDVVTLDNYFLKNDILPNLIKIDAEGHEKEVLLSGIELLKKCKPKIIIECEDRHLNEGEIQDVFKLMIDIGYKGYFYEDKKLKPLSEFKTHVHQKTSSHRFWEEKEYVNNFIFEAL